VVGVEADIQGLQSDRNDIVRGTFTSFDQPAVVESVDVIREGGLNGFGTVRARGGIAFDRILVFGTGGFAAARREGDRLDGYAIGGGVEFDIAYFMPFLGPSAKGFLPVSTLTIEGLFVNLGEDRGPRSGVLGGLPSGELPGSAIRLRRSESDFGIARAKINLLF
jgi:outer membrane immunogenic protein